MPTELTKPSPLPSVPSVTRQCCRGMHGLVQGIGARYAAMDKWRRRMTLAVLALGLLVACHRPIEEGSSHWLAERIPVSWIRAASAANLTRLDASVLAPSQTPYETQEALRARFAALRTPDKETPPYKLVFRRGQTLGAVIFALPGGEIVITDEFLAQHRNGRELLGQLATQLGHLRYGHTLRSHVEHAPLGLLSAVIRNDTARGVNLLAEATPIIQHDPECIAQAEAFRDAMMRANP